MCHCAQEKEKGLARVAQLAQRKSTYEAGLVAIAACGETPPCSIQVTQVIVDRPFSPQYEPFAHSTGNVVVDTNSGFFFLSLV